MAYKDEYEVARLYTNGEFAAKIRQQFEDGHRLRFHLAAPLLSRRNKTSGHLEKRSYGPWMLYVFKLLARGRRLRGTVLDPFGRTTERRMERTLIESYEASMRENLELLGPQTMPIFVQLAKLPEAIRGFGHVKEANSNRAAVEQAQLLAALRPRTQMLVTAAE